MTAWPPHSTSADGPLRLIHDQRLRLGQVTAQVWDSPFTRSVKALSLTFDAVSLMLIAEADDSLTLADEAARSTDPELSSMSLTGEQPWRRALGKPLLWSWSMTNQQGYRDGLQLEFAVSVMDSPVVIQLMVEASTIKVRHIEMTETRHPRRRN